tara:strand:- start:42 stop:278 length:237 start_codon:yes stop_codon:yes gene_type:complete
MLYLIYASKEAAIERADEEGKEIGYSYWIHGIGTRWRTFPDETADGTWALDVTNYDLDESEKASTVDHYTPLPEPDED